MNAPNMVGKMLVPRPVVVATVAATLLLAAGALSSLFLRYASPDDICSNRLLNEYPSPDGSAKVVTFLRDCGATTPFSVQVAVLSHGEFLPLDPDSVFVADDNHGEVPVGSDGTPAVIVRWRQPRSVLVEYPSGLRIFKAEASSSSVRFEYSPVDG